MPKLTATEVTHIKYECEGREQLLSLYKRLEWDTAKTVRLSFLEKDAIDLLLSDPEEYYLGADTISALNKAMGRMISNVDN